MLRLLIIIFLSSALYSVEGEQIIPWYRAPSSNSVWFGTDGAGTEMTGFLIQVQFSSSYTLNTRGVVEVSQQRAYGFNHTYQPYREGLVSYSNDMVCYVLGPQIIDSVTGIVHRETIGEQPNYLPADYFVQSTFRDYLAYRAAHGGLDVNSVNIDTFEQFLRTYHWFGDPRNPDYLPGSGPQVPGTGPPGPPGPQGEQGTQGPQGNQGDDGDPGHIGPIGPAGTNGIDGAQGPRGESGPAGLDGAPGLNGTNGLAGPQGSKGETGPTGLTGKDGVAGSPGSVGATGPAGPAGTNGDGTGISIDLGPVVSSVNKVDVSVNKVDDSIKKIQEILSPQIIDSPPLEQPAGSDVVQFDSSKNFSDISFVPNSKVTSIRDLKQTGDPASLDISLSSVWPSAMGVAPHYVFSFSDQPSTTNTIRTSVRNGLLLLLYLGFLFSSYRLLLKAL